MSEPMEETSITSKLSQEVQQELPTIYGSVKNLIACALGKSYDAPLDPKIAPQNAMTCAKYLLQAIRSHPLPDVEEFCAQYPQPEDQLGVDRLEDICKYKVIYALRYKAEEKGGKITRLFGRSYIKWTKMWKVFRSSTVELIKENTHIPMDEIEFFLQTYEESLAQDGKELIVFLFAFKTFVYRPYLFCLPFNRQSGKVCHSELDLDHRLQCRTQRHAEGTPPACRREATRHHTRPVLAGGAALSAHRISFATPAVLRQPHGACVPFAGHDHGTAGPGAPAQCRARVVGEHVP